MSGMKLQIHKNQLILYIYIPIYNLQSHLGIISRFLDQWITGELTCWPCCVILEHAMILSGATASSLGIIAL